MDLNKGGLYCGVLLQRLCISYASGDAVDAFGLSNLPRLLFFAPSWYIIWTACNLSRVICVGLEQSCPSFYPRSLLDLPFEIHASNRTVGSAGLELSDIKPQTWPDLN